MPFWPYPRFYDAVSGVYLIPVRFVLGQVVRDPVSGGFPREKVSSFKRGEDFNFLGNLVYRGSDDFGHSKARSELLGELSRKMINRG